MQPARWPVLLFSLALPLAAQTDLFEKKIRPVLATKCFACHSSKLKAPMGGLALDTKAGLAKEVAPGKPAASRLYTALQYKDAHLQMPPSGKLPDAVLADFNRWIIAGAADPRVDSPAAAAGPKRMDLETGRKWWAFQPLHESPASKGIDSFIRAKLDAAHLAPSPEADAFTLLRRASFDLTGLPPTYEQAQAFTKDGYAALIDKLLASPHYGERWGRYWLDVARYAEDNPTSEATNGPYPYAWRYRDWVIESVNNDLPYDRFVKLQLAADLMPDTKRDDLRALGYVGAAPIYHKDARLSKEVIETLASDDWDERVDAVSRGLLGMTVACARCHDHKFDPITSKDYYGLAGVFASTAAVQRPLREIPPDIEEKFLFAEQRLIHLSYLANLMTNEPGTKPDEAREKAERFKDDIARIKVETRPLVADYPELRDYIEKFGTPGATRQRGGADPNLPFINAVYDSALWVDGSDADLTVMDYRPGKPRDLPVFLHGNPGTPGDSAPRAFPAVLAKSDAHFASASSGRLDLANRIFTDAAPLAARVMVNRVWGWHFGKPLVDTPSDFGTQGSKPTHPELLDELAARFVAHGWSLKWLHREIMLSAAYRQSSRDRADGEKADATNQLLWRMNPRRLDIEAFRDSILTAAGTLDDKLGGPSIDLDAAGNTRRTVYAKVSRGRLNTLLRIYDFSDPAQHSPGREMTTTPLQQLFLLNSPFIEEQAKALAARCDAEPDNAAKVRALYRFAFARDPEPKQVDLALSYLDKATLEQYAQALLSTNEFIYWP